MATIQIRIDDDTKKTANKILDTLGIDMSSAVKVYLKQIIIHHGIPLPLITENWLHPAKERAILKASEDVRKGKNVTSKMSVKEAIDYLKKL